LKSFPCWIGVDLAEVRDIAALIALFKLARTVRCGRPVLSAAGRRRQVADRAAVRDGSAKASSSRPRATRPTSGASKPTSSSWCDLLPNVKEIDFDRALAAQMQQDAEARARAAHGPRCRRAFVVTVPQDTSDDGPGDEDDRAPGAREALQHDGNPAMAWMISNVVVDRNYERRNLPEQGRRERLAEQDRRAGRALHLHVGAVLDGVKPMATAAPSSGRRPRPRLR
jgi:phage terminase large subunit-like protein